jgi:hypothetical protein
MAPAGPSTSCSIAPKTVSLSPEHAPLRVFATGAEGRHVCGANSRSLVLGSDMPIRSGRVCPWRSFLKSGVGMGILSSGMQTRGKSAVDVATAACLASRLLFERDTSRSEKTSADIGTRQLGPSGDAIRRVSAVLRP